MKKLQKIYKNEIEIKNFSCDNLCNNLENNNGSKDRINDESSENVIICVIIIVLALYFKNNLNLVNLI